MKRSSIRSQVWIVTALLTTLAPRFARADGGIIRLRGVQGPFSVTVFTAPEAASGGLADISLPPQTRNTGGGGLGGRGSLTLYSPSRAAGELLEPLFGPPPASASSRLAGYPP